jgi:TRAP-type C4-dicarboxylate transport system permease small subunit
MDENPSDTPEAPSATGASRLERITGMIAAAGGALALAISMLVTVSVLGRWLFNAPIDGDFEFVEIGTALGVFAYLPYTQARRGHIMVDTFTMRFRERTRNRIDAFWDIVYALAIGLCAYALFHGTLDTIQNGQTTMQRQIALWPSIALSATLCAIAALTGILSAIAIAHRPNRGTTP